MTAQNLSFDQTELELWAGVISHGDIACRQQLFDKYHELARVNAAKMYSRNWLPSIEYADYYQHAVVGLLEAIDRFDPTRGSSFQNYATICIRGSIMNYIDKATELQEQLAFRRRLRQERVSSLLEESAANDRFNSMVEITLEIAVGVLLDDSSMLVSDEEQPLSVARYRQRAVDDLVELVRDVVETLPEVEKSIIKNHYFHEHTFAEIAEQLGYTKGRISQLHRLAVGKIKQQCLSESQLDVQY